MFYESEDILENLLQKIKDDLIKNHEDIVEKNCLLISCGKMYPYMEYWWVNISSIYVGHIMPWGDEFIFRYEKTIATDTFSDTGAECFTKVKTVMQKKWSVEIEHEKEEGFGDEAGSKISEGIL